MANNTQTQPLDDSWPKHGRDLMDREHAVYTVVSLLEALRLANWTHTLVGWLGNYDGLETRLPLEHDPVVCVRQLLNQYLLRGQSVEIGRIAVDLCSLPFLHHRAAWVNDARQERRNWMPLEQAWLEFVDQGEPDEELRMWDSPEPWPPREQLRQHLLSGYVRQNGLR